MKKRCDTFKEIAVAGVQGGRSVIEVARILGVAKSALYRWLAEDADAKTKGMAARELAAVNEIAAIRVEVDGMLALDLEIRACLAIIEVGIGRSKRDVDQLLGCGSTSGLQGDLWR